ncbi:unnamed protein product [Didymodactylos carnosus]|uniref:Uncharacterized protein n=1 Tax=Didymodactylos carnosus TaxID=1234261 RepID=A0A813REC1_9BILA|nr:unnamed protein product [Didymodactylos carnosus]CAF0781305.1 unnamed protein product [Didymodactylos carnosus]CAF3498627.1 unnamed protein product [Didymodactylos carnosus]CAF3564611.1 unnamed protein product [Didymodactylos carnosus]
MDKANQDCYFYVTSTCTRRSANSSTCYFESSTTGCLKVNCPYIHVKPRQFVGMAITSDVGGSNLRLNKDIGKTQNSPILTANTTPVLPNTFPDTALTNLHITMQTAKTDSTTVDRNTPITDSLPETPIQNIILTIPPTIKIVESASNLNIPTSDTNTQMETNNQCEKSSVLYSLSSSSNVPLFTKSSSSVQLPRRVMLPLKNTAVMDQSLESINSDNGILKSTTNNRFVITESKPENDEQSIVRTTSIDISKTKPERNVVISDTRSTTAPQSTIPRKFVTVKKSTRMIVTTDSSIKSRITSNKFPMSQQNNCEQLKITDDNVKHSRKQSITPPPLNDCDEDSDMDLDDLIEQENKKQGVSMKPILTNRSLVDISFPCSVQSNRFSFMTMKQPQQQQPSTTNEQKNSKPIRLKREHLTTSSNSHSIPSPSSSSTTTQSSTNTTNLTASLPVHVHLEKKESKGILGSSQQQKTNSSPQKQSILHDHQKGRENNDQPSIICSSMINPSAGSTLINKNNSLDEANSDIIQQTDMCSSLSLSPSATSKTSNNCKRSSPVTQSPTAPKRFANEVASPPIIGDLCVTELSSTSNNNMNRRYYYQQQQRNSPSKSPSQLRTMKSKTRDILSTNRPMSSFDWNKETNDFIKSLQKTSPSITTTNQPIINHTTMIRPLMQQSSSLQHALQNGNIRAQPCIEVKQYNNASSFKQAPLVNKINDVKSKSITSPTINQDIKAIDPPLELPLIGKDKEEKQIISLLSSEQIDSVVTVNNNNNNNNGVDLSNQSATTTQKQSIPAQIIASDVTAVTAPMTTDDFDGLLLNDIDFLDEAFQAADEFLLLYKSSI